MAIAFELIIIAFGFQTITMNGGVITDKMIMVTAVLFEALFATIGIKYLIFKALKP